MKNAAQKLRVMLFLYLCALWVQFKGQLRIQLMAIRLQQETFHMSISRRLIGTLTYMAVAASPLLCQSPSISKVENNYSYIAPGLPNYGISPGTLFVIFGSNLSTVAVPVLQSSTPPGVPLVLNGVSVSVTVNGQTAQVPLYYVSTMLVAGILPSVIPPGTGTITLTNNGQTSAPAPLQVVANNFGILTTNNGSGPAAAYDAASRLITRTNSTSPGQTIGLWGSGVGADPGNDDRTFPQTQNNLTNIPLQAFIGGMSAPVVYRGRSQFPGVDQVNVTVPAGVPTGCYVSLILMSGSFVSNSSTLSISPTGGVCSDPNTKYSPSQLQSVSRQSTVNVGTILVDQMSDFIKNTVVTLFRGKFLRYSANEYQVKTPSEGFISYGSCQILTPTANTVHLSAGPALNIFGPGGTQASASLTTLKDGTLGDYKSRLPAGFIPPGGGTFSFSNGSGSTTIGPLSQAAVSMPGAITWTNMGAVSTIDRSQGTTLTWSGGSPGTFVVIEGSSTTQTTPAITVDFNCAAPVNAGRFTLPPSLLLALPPSGTGDLTLSNVSFPAPAVAPGLDLGSVFARIGWKVPVSYR